MCVLYHLYTQISLRRARTAIQSLTRLCTIERYCTYIFNIINIHKHTHIHKLNTNRKVIVTTLLIVEEKITLQFPLKCIPTGGRPDTERKCVPEKNRLNMKGRMYKICSMRRAKQ